MPDFRPRPAHMAVANQLGRPAHTPATVQQATAQVQAASSASASHLALVALGGDYAATPGSLSTYLSDIDARVSALELP